MISETFNWVQNIKYSQLVYQMSEELLKFIVLGQ